MIPESNLIAKGADLAAEFAKEHGWLRVTSTLFMRSDKPGHQEWIHYRFDVKKSWVGVASGTPLYLGPRHTERQDWPEIQRAIGRGHFKVREA